MGYAYNYLDVEDESSTNIGELGSLTVWEAGANRESTISYEYDSFYRLKSKTLTTPGTLEMTTGYTFQATGTRTTTLLSGYTSTVTGSSGLLPVYGQGGLHPRKA